VKGGLVAAAAVVGLVAAAVSAGRRAATVATVRGSSMTPAFTDGERVLALRHRCYRPGDVIVFRAPAEQSVGGEPPWRIKRVAAVAGEQTPQIQRRHRGSRVPAAVVPAGHVVVVGDSPNSQDSRQLGYVPVRAIAGRVHPHRPAPTSTDQHRPAPTSTDQHRLAPTAALATASRRPSRRR
jgi:signal peptidase I